MVTSLPLAGDIELVSGANESGERGKNASHPRMYFRQSFRIEVLRLLFPITEHNHEPRASTEYSS